MKLWISILWAVVMAGMLGGTIYAVVHFHEYFQQFPGILVRVTWGEWGLILLAAASCFLLDFLRLYTLLRLVGFHLPVKTGFQAMVVSEFASMVTPTAELHIPATVYVLAKKNVPVAKATAAVVSKTLYILLWVAVAGLAALAFSDTGKLPDWIRQNARYCVIPVAGIVAFFACIIFGAVPIHEWIEKRLHGATVKPWLRKIMLWLDHSTGALATIGKSTDLMHMLAHVFSIGYILAYCVTGYCLAFAVGMDLSFARALVVFALSLVVTYMGVVPGSIGVSEVATMYLLSPQMSQRAMAVAVLLRVLTRYVALIPGAIVFGRIVLKDGLKSLPRADEAVPEPARTGAK